MDKLRGHPEHAAPSLKGLWETMNTGGFSQALMTDLKRFNGGLFKDASEQATMRRAAQISAGAHVRAMQLSARMLRAATNAAAEKYSR